MTLLDSAPYNEQRDRWIRAITITVVAAIVIAGAGYLYYPHYMAQRTINEFMQALVDKNFQEAYAIWQADPKLYPMDAFMKDWGPDSQWGIIKTYSIRQLGPPPGGNSSGLVALVEINGIQSDEARIWIQNGSRLLSFYQF